MANTVCVDNKWFVEGATDIDFLRANEKFQKRSDRHCPVASAQILQKFRDQARVYGLTLVNEKGALRKTGDRYIYTAEVLDNTHPDFALSVGFRNFNDGSLTFSGMCGNSIFVCQNGVCTSIVIPSRQRHLNSINQNLDAKIATIFDRFLEDGKKTVEQIECMKNTKCDDALVGQFIMALARSGNMGNTHILDILREYDNPTLNSKDDTSAFRLMNAASYVTTHKIKNPNQAMLASQLANNTLMKLIQDGFTPLGDVVDVGTALTVIG